MYCETELFEMRRELINLNKNLKDRVEKLALLGQHKIMDHTISKNNLIVFKKMGVLILFFKLKNYYLKNNYKKTL